MVTRVLIVGAGPAGCAAAIRLREKRFEVTVVERESYGREKVCGDGIIPDAQSALKDLGLYREVKKESRNVKTSTFNVHGVKLALNTPMWIIERKNLDKILQNKAVESGAKIIYNTVVDKVETTKQGVSVIAERKKYSADILLLATGMDTTLAEQLGFSPATQGAAAIRGYAPNDCNLDSSVLWFDETIGDGYGWAFPAPNNKINIGVGVFSGNQSKKSLPKLLDHTKDMLQIEFGFETELEQVRLWRLNTGLTSARFSSDKVILLGENISTTYNMTGEGVGKALESGIIAAEVIAETKTFTASKLSEYDKRIRQKMQAKHDSYTKARKLIQMPKASRMCAKVAKHHPKAQRMIIDVYTEKHPPNYLFSKRGIFRLFSPF